MAKKKPTLRRKTGSTAVTRNPNDATFRNINALKKKVEDLDSNTAQYLAGILRRLEDLEDNRRRHETDLALHDNAISTLIDEVSEINTLLDIDNHEDSEGAA